MAGLLLIRTDPGGWGMAAGFRTILLAGLAIGSVGGVVLPDLNFEDAAPGRVQALSVDSEPSGALEPTATADLGPSATDAEQTRPEVLGEAEEREATLPTLSRCPRQNRPCSSRR